jgi:hypothetical protein
VTELFDAPTLDRICQRDGCDTVISPDAHRLTKYCPEHAPVPKPKKPKDKAPKSTVNVNLGGPPPRPSSKDKRAAEVEAGARVMLSLLVTGIGIAGDDVCAGAWNAAIPRLATQLGELSRYHPGLEKVFAPVGEGGELGLWLGFGTVLAPPLVATLAHHHVLPDALAARIAGTAQAAVEAAEQAAAEADVVAA